MRFSFPMTICADGYEIVSIREWNAKLKAAQGGLRHPIGEMQTFDYLNDKTWRRDEEGLGDLELDFLKDTGIVAKSRRYISPKPDAFSIKRLYMRLAQVEDSIEGILSFVNNYGFPSGHGFAHPVYSKPGGLLLQTMEVMNFIYERKFVRQSIMVVGGPYFEDDKIDWEIVEYFRDFQSLYYTSSEISISIRKGADNKPSLSFHIPSMRTAIQLQLILDVTRGARFKKCRNPACSEWFEYGPGTKPLRLERSEYCTPKCQNAHAYQRKKESRK